MKLIHADGTEETISYNIALFELSGYKRNQHKCVIHVGKWTITSIQKVQWYDNGRAVSVFSVTQRKLIFSTKGKEIIIELKNWQGDFLSRAMLDARLVPKKSKYSMAIRGVPAFKAKFICKTNDGKKIYSRRIFGEHYDYAIKETGKKVKFIKELS